jgi:hypothetical protein
MKGAGGLLALGLLGACNRYAVMEGDLKAAAARDLACNADDIELEDTTQRQRQLLELAGAPTQAYARGCGKRLVYARMCKADGSACDWYSVKQLRLEPLLERAAFEMHCSKEKLTTHQLAPSTVGVSGCEQQGTYVWNCPHNQDFFSPACNWVLNNSSARTAVPATQ